MRAWEALSTEEQEKAIGCRKFDDRELDENDSDTGGNELKIVRTTMPFANHFQRRIGTYFIGYAGTFSTTRKMLENMFIGDPAGNTDRLLDFSTAVTGTLFFGPSQDLLEELGK
ncbi:hypothetical protein AGMMS50248_03600 [Deltaproteobacteria bacterium]|nr:Dyp-type peroxidase domain-containing protein [Candidatus Desulfovibrio trichonymphae]GHU91584.1 hypothetical protein AGMMS49925_06990 [Deltaproteobacteria bacterium]GHU97934.1 hypothetical protein AGMMS50248_03600 [Deltaproteobacteria bacterium]